MSSGSPWSPPFPMDKKAANSVSCRRCGRVYEKSHHKATPTPEFCRDCRESDPWCIALFMGWDPVPLDRLGYPATLDLANDRLGYWAAYGYADDWATLDVAV